MSDVIKARRFAEIAHANKRYGTDINGDDIPYTVHLENVLNVLIRFGFTDPILLSAAWLHDTMEDTGTSYNDLKKRFGFDVAEIVYLVTDEKGRNREERHAKTYPEIAKCSKAKLIKLADRIANVENQGLSDMYKKEYPKFRGYLNTFGEYENMWKHLDSLMGFTA